MVKDAVDDVFELYRNNKWNWSYCVGIIAKRYGLDYTYLLSQCGNKKKRKTNNINSKRINKTPWWID